MGDVALGDVALGGVASADTGGKAEGRIKRDPPEVPPAPEPRQLATTLIAGVGRPFAHAASPKCWWFMAAQMKPASSRATATFALFEATPRRTRR